MAAAAVAVKRAGYVLRPPTSPAPVAASGGRRAPRPEPPKSGPAAAASQDPLHPSRIRPLSRAGLIPGFLLSALFNVVVFFLSGLSAVRHCCPPRTPESQVRPSVFYWSSLPGRPLSFCSKKQPRDSKRGVHFTAADENKGTIPHQCRKHYLKYDVSSQSIQL